MHFLVLGASGRTGQLVVSHAISQGHTITALVRTPSTFPTASNNIALVKGTPTSQTDLDTALSINPEIDAVIITLAVARQSDSPFSKLVSPRFLIRDAVRVLLPQMKAHGVRKLVVMSSFGSGGSWKNMAWPMKLVFKYSNMSFVLEDHDAVEQELKESEGIEWSLIKPAMLKDGEGKTVREFGEIGEGLGMLDGITRKSAAEVLVKAVGTKDWNRRTVVIAN